MKFYGVGTRFGGTEQFLNDCLKYNFWCMGDSEQKYKSIYDSIETGDILVAKKYYTQNNIAIMEIEAIGIVDNCKMPENVPAKYFTDDKFGVSVMWIKQFKNPVVLNSREYKLGGSKTNTIFKLFNEKDMNLILKFKEMIKYSYKGE